MERDPIVWKVNVAADGIETVYLVSACSRREAEIAVLSSIPLPEMPESLSDGDRAAWRAVLNNNATPYAYGKVHRCSVGATEWSADSPYRLYTLDTKTGAMS